nr:MAG TPA: hypothetical protein [Caudoviricetes sp.]
MCFCAGILIAILNVQNLADGLDNLRRGELTCFNLVLLCWYPDCNPECPKSRRWPGQS